MTEPEIFGWAVAYSFMIPCYIDSLIHERSFRILDSSHVVREIEDYHTLLS